MEYENPMSGKNTECLHSDMISSLPQNIIESTLSLMPIRDALRTCILSKKRRYSWRSMPKLAFTNVLVKLPSNSGCTQLKCKVANAIFHVLLLHNGPEILQFKCSVGMESEFAQIMSYLAKGNKLKQLIFINDNGSYKLPVSFFSLQGLELKRLKNCTFEPPLTSNIFSRLKSTTFWNVEVSAQMLQRFLSKCPLLDYLYLALGAHKIIRVEDIVNQIANLGPHFMEVCNLLCPFFLNKPEKAPHCMYCIDGFLCC